MDIEDYRTRFKTLQAIARQYAVSPECFGVMKIWRHREANAGSQPLIDDVVRRGRAAE